MTAPVKARLFVAADLAASLAVDLPADQAHYLRNVLRLAAGDAVALFNGRDGEFRAAIAQADKKACRLQVGEQLRPFRASSDLWLCFAPIRQGRIEMIVEKATELGAGRLQPVLTRRSQVTRVNTERLAAHAREAAEQCERLDLPAMAEAISLEKLLADWPAGRRLLFCQERSDAPALLAAVQALPQDVPLGILTGPEGGFAPEEMAAIARLPQALPVSLGPLILRAETAAIAALAIVQAVRQN
ncbi:16S rRNA (uracil(1498)-N(3))-methyltransferase [Ferrovibrio xuzhouensis]|uniref:Ribosomal RNA small subunit methyltransferase E n=1 Tax=Ferrovibrio xuzhouensis TaxID=1576914 RepID=A0ABV7VHR0_9PROT